MITWVSAESGRRYAADDLALRRGPGPARRNRHRQRRAAQRDAGRGRPAAARGAARRRCRSPPAGRSRATTARPGAPRSAATSTTSSRSSDGRLGAVRRRRHGPRRRGGRGDGADAGGGPGLRRRRPRPAVVLRKLDRDVRAVRHRPAGHDGLPGGRPGAGTSSWSPTPATRRPVRAARPTAPSSSCRCADGLPLGVAARRGRRLTACRSASGDTLLAFTDGLVERRDEDIDTGVDRLRHRRADDGRSETLREGVERLVEAVRDDACRRRHGRPGPAADELSEAPRPTTPARGDRRRRCDAGRGATSAGS